MSKLSITQKDLSIICDCGAVHTVIKDGDEYKLKSAYKKPKENEPIEPTKKENFLDELYGKSDNGGE